MFSFIFLTSYAKFSYKLINLEINAILLYWFRDLNQVYQQKTKSKIDLTKRQFQQTCAPSNLFKVYIQFYNFLTYLLKFKSIYMELITFQQKVGYVYNNAKNIPEIYQKDLMKILKILKESQNKEQVYQVNQRAAKLKLQTFYRCLLPQIDFFQFKQGHYANPYIIVGIVAFKNKQLGYSIINWKFCTWVQSGGARCIPITQQQITQSQLENKNSELIQKLRNVHAVFVPQYTDNYNQSAAFVYNLMHAIQKVNQKALVFSFGNSSNLILKKNNNLQLQDKKKDATFTKRQQVQVYSDWNDQIFQDIDISTRLMVQNRPKVTTLQTKCVLSLKQIQNLKYFNSSSTSIYYSSLFNEFQVATLCQKQQAQTYYFSYLQLNSLSNHASIQFCHAVVNNFLNMARKDQKIVKEKFKMVGHFKLVYEQSEEKAHYKIAKT